MTKNGLEAISLKFIRVSYKTCWTFIQLRDHDGKIGEGEASLTGRETLLQEAAKRIIPKALSEARPSEPSSFAQQNFPSDIAESSITSAIDQALWSLHAQAADLSLAETIGTSRESIPVYANINRRTDDRSPIGFADSARTAIESGHIAFKVAPFDEVSTRICAQGDGEKAMQAGLDRIAAVREMIGPTKRLMVDCHWRFDEKTARKLNHALAKLGIYWVECPLPEVESNIPALSRLRYQCNEMGMHHAGLETNIGWDSFRPYCEGGAYDVVMPDIKYIGGIHELQRTAEESALLGIEVSPHNPSGPIAHAASLQISRVLADFDMLELQFNESPLFDQLVATPFRPIQNGLTKTPEGQGLGVNLVDSIMQKNFESQTLEWD